MQFLGLLGIYTEAYKLVFRCRKIFSQRTLTLILPLSIIFLAHGEVSEILYWRIRYTEFLLRRTRVGSPKYRWLSDRVSSELRFTDIPFKAVHLAFLLAFSLLSTSAVVYTVASAYTSREVTFKNVMSVVPNVWKRLMVTFLCTLLVFCAANIVFGALTIYLWADALADSKVETLFPSIISGLSAIGFVYMPLKFHRK